MRHEGFRVVFTKAEMHLLLLCSLRHYDRVCRDAGNVGGFLYGLKNRLDEDGDVAADLEFRQLDTLAKIVEPVCMASQEQVDLYFELRHALKALNEESNSLNR